MKQIDINNVWLVIKKDKKIIALISGGAVFFAVIYCLFATPIYMASVVINPPKISDSGSGLNSFAYGLSAMGGFYQKSDTDIAMAMLKTRVVADQIINHFNLIKYYKAKNIVEARKELAKVTTYNADAKSGFLEIKVDDRTPAIAAGLANYYVIALGNLVSNIGLYKAMQKSKFYDAQVAAAKTDLLNAQNAVKTFLNTNGVTAGNQAIIAAGISTQLQAQLAIARSQLHAIERYATADNPDYKQLQSQIAGLNAQIISLGGTRKDEIAIPSNLAPALAQDYLNLAMQVAFRGEIYNLLMKQYEINRLDTLSDQQPLAVQIIDPAVVPTYKSKPNSLKIIWVVLLLAVLVAVLFILVKNHKLIYVK